MIELTLVLLVIGIVAAMALPSLVGFASGRQTSDAAQGLLSLTRWAQSQAITQARPCRLNFDPRAGTYWLTVQEQGEYVPLKTGLGQTFRLPEGASMDLQFDQDPDQTSRGRGPSAGLGGLFSSFARKSSSQRNYIEFHPSGRCDVATIQVHGKKGEIYVISCASATEPFVMNSSSEER